MPVQNIVIELRKLKEKLESYQKGIYGFLNFVFFRQWNSFLKDTINDINRIGIALNDVRNPLTSQNFSDFYQKLADIEIKLQKKADIKQSILTVCDSLILQSIKDKPFVPTVKEIIDILRSAQTTIELRPKKGIYRIIAWFRTSSAKRPRAQEVESVALLRKNLLNNACEDKTGFRDFLTVQVTKVRGSLKDKLQHIILKLESEIEKDRQHNNFNLLFRALSREATIPEQEAVLSWSLKDAQAMEELFGSYLNSTLQGLGHALLLLPVNEKQQAILIKLLTLTDNKNLLPLLEIENAFFEINTKINTSELKSFFQLRFMEKLSESTKNLFHNHPVLNNYFHALYTHFCIKATLACEPFNIDNLLEQLVSYQVWYGGYGKNHYPQLGTSLDNKFKILHEKVKEKILNDIVTLIQSASTEMLIQRYGKDEKESFKYDAYRVNKKEIINTVVNAINENRLDANYQKILAVLNPGDLHDIKVAWSTKQCFPFQNKDIDEFLKLVNGDTPEHFFYSGDESLKEKLVSFENQRPTRYQQLIIEAFKTAYQSLLNTGNVTEDDKHALQVLHASYDDYSVNYSVVSQYTRPTSGDNSYNESLQKLSHLWKDSNSPPEIKTELETCIKKAWDDLVRDIVAYFKQEQQENFPQQLKDYLNRVRVFPAEISIGQSSADTSTLKQMDMAIMFFNSINDTSDCNTLMEFYLKNISQLVESKDDVSNLSLAEGENKRTIIVTINYNDSPNAVTFAKALRLERECNKFHIESLLQRFAILLASDPELREREIHITIQNIVEFLKREDVGSDIKNSIKQEIKLRWDDFILERSDIPRSDSRIHLDWQQKLDCIRIFPTAIILSVDKEDYQVNFLDNLVHLITQLEKNKSYELIKYLLSKSDLNSLLMNVHQRPQILKLSEEQNTNSGRLIRHAWIYAESPTAEFLNNVITLVKLFDLQQIDEVNSLTGAAMINVIIDSYNNLKGIIGYITAKDSQDIKQLKQMLQNFENHGSVDPKNKNQFHNMSLIRELLAKVSKIIDNAFVANQQVLNGDYVFYLCKIKLLCCYDLEVTRLKQDWLKEALAIMALYNSSQLLVLNQLPKEQFTCQINKLQWAVCIIQEYEFNTEKQILKECANFISHQHLLCLAKDSDNSMEIFEDQIMPFADSFYQEKCKGVCDERDICKKSNLAKQALAFELLSKQFQYESKMLVEAIKKAIPRYNSAPERVNRAIKGSSSSLFSFFNTVTRDLTMPSIEVDNVTKVLDSLCRICSLEDFTTFEGQFVNTLKNLFGELTCIDNSLSSRYELLKNLIVSINPKQEILEQRTNLLIKVLDELDFSNPAQVKNFAFVLECLVACPVENKQEFFGKLKVNLSKMINATLNKKPIDQGTYDSAIAIKAYLLLSELLVDTKEEIKSKAGNVIERFNAENQLLSELKSDDLTTAQTALDAFNNHLVNKEIILPEKTYEAIRKIIVARIDELASDVKDRNVFYRDAYKPLYAFIGVHPVPQPSNRSISLGNLAMMLPPT